MNAKIMTRIAVFAIAGSLVAGCATQQGTNTAVGTGVGAGAGA
ncbi:outer membrane protein, OmpA/MotB family, partial [Burkholderia sp. H160]